jgi:tetratricopeptide (TPR) repeat protein
MGALFMTIRKYNINQVLKAVVGGVSFIIFSYGIIQKFVLFPLYLRNFSNVSPGENVYLEALVERIKSGRIFSIFRLPTLYAIICAVLILFIFHYLLKAKSSGPSGVSRQKIYNSRIAWAFLLVLGMINLLLTQSFGGIIYLSAGILAYLLLSGILKFKYLAPILMILCLLFSLTIALRYSEARKMEPAALRMSNWNQAVRVIASSPFWGVGLGNYEAVVSYYTRPEEAKSIYAHNFFLQFIAEVGVMVPLFLALLLFSLRKKLKPFFPGDGEGKGEKALYISIFFILLTYNLIDIGFYFFPAALAGVVVLSQIYPADENRRTSNTTNRRHYVTVAATVFFAMLMALEAFSDNYRVEADILHLQKQYSEAEDNYKKSLQFNPYNFRALIGYASAKFYREQPAEARQYLERALALYPDSASAHHLKSRIEWQAGRPWQAFFHASYAYRKNNISAEYHNWYLTLKNGLEKHLDQVKQEKNEKQ